MPLQTGQMLNNRYRIVNLLGQGGFGAVYKTWDTKLNGPCAIKENFDTSPEAERQFAREASILFNLRHPCLPRVFDQFSIPEQGQYLVMDYIEGKDLQKILDQSGKSLPENQVLPWIVQICDALEYLHSQKPPVIHRDIKPANIKITPTGQAVLVDFGIAKIYDPLLKTTISARAVTPGYSPPEQYGQGTTNPRTDVYALGATLYTALTNTPPPDSVDILTKKQPTPVPTRTINPSTSPAVDTAIARAMHLEEDLRFQSVLEFRTALRAKQIVFTGSNSLQTQVTKTTLIPDGSTQRVEVQQGNFTPKRFPKWLPWAGIAVILIVVITLIGMGLGSGKGEDELTPLTEVAESTTNGPSDSEGGLSQTDSSTGGMDTTTGVQLTPQMGLPPSLGFGNKLAFQGQIGGNSYAVDMQGGVALLGVGPRMYVLDVSNPSTPQFVGQTAIMPGVVRDIIVEGNFAYVAAGKGYLRVIDISNPANPLEVASYVEGSYAMGLALDENTIYIADNPFGLRAIDISDPLQPRKAGEQKVPGASSSVYISGSRAYLAGSTLGTLVVIDISNPAGLVDLGSVDIPEAAGSMFVAVQVRGNYAFVAAGNAGLVIIDISDPSQPVKVGGYQTSWADGLVIDGDTLYLSDWADGLHVLDISNPVNPSQSGFMEIKMSGQQFPGQRNMVAQNGKVLIANINQGLTIVDATSPSNPVLAGRFDTPLPGAAFDVVVSAGTAIVIEDLLGMYVVDVSSPTQPQQLGFDISRGLRTPRGVVTIDSIVYLVDINDGFSIYDISMPSNPIELVQVEKPQGMTDVAVAGNFAYISLKDHKPENRGMLIFDISNPSDPKQVGFVRTDSYAMALESQGDYVYYPEFIEMGETGNPSSLRVFELSNPAAPTQVGEAVLTTLAPTVMGIDIAGNYAFLGDQNTGLHIFDISNPVQPVEVGSLFEIRMVMDLVVVGDKVFTASYGSVNVIDISDPTNPTLEDMVPTSGLSMGIYAIESTVYVADFDGGLVIFNYVE
jgi:serine/threonine protein kinase